MKKESISPLLPMSRSGLFLKSLSLTVFLLAAVVSSEPPGKHGVYPADEIPLEVNDKAWSTCTSFEELFRIRGVVPQAKTDLDEKTHRLYMDLIQFIAGNMKNRLNELGDFNGVDAKTKKDKRERLLETIQRIENYSKNGDMLMGAIANTGSTAAVLRFKANGKMRTYLTFPGDFPSKYFSYPEFYEGIMMQEFKHLDDIRLQVPQTAHETDSINQTFLKK
jgi:hypothetical protein